MIKLLLFLETLEQFTAFYQIIARITKNQMLVKFSWGVTTTQSYLPLDNSSFFQDGELNLVDWLRQYAQTEEEREEVFLRGFLGKMIFSGEEALKKVTSYLEEKKCAVCFQE